MRRLILFAMLLVTPVCFAKRPVAKRHRTKPAAPPHRMQLGIDADNWSGQISNPQFERSLRLMNLDFISWHIQPGEEADPRHILEIAQFCRRNHWAYLFNTEFGNYKREEASMQHGDGTYRYDIADRTLALLKDDPLFLGVVYDETDLMQALLGIRDERGKVLPAYLAQTRSLNPVQAFDLVSHRVNDLVRRYKAYGKRVIFEMTFPDYAHAYARGGGLLAPKLLKENFNDLMYSVYRGAALEYHAPELWTCIDLWFLDKFPFNGRCSGTCHTPAQLLESLEYADAAGFDYAYIEQIKGLLDEKYNLTEYGNQVLAFQHWRATHTSGDWRTAPIQFYVTRFPDGYWGQTYSAFIPDHPYGSWTGNPFRGLDDAWFHKLQELSHGTIPAEALTWNAAASPHFKNRPYQTMAALPPMVVFDPFGTLPPNTHATVLDFSPKNLPKLSALP